MRSIAVFTRTAAIAVSLGFAGGCAWLLDISPGTLDEDAGHAGASGSGASSSVGGSDGGAIACDAQVDCPAPQFPDCRSVACVEGLCAVEDAPAGKALASQIAGDCLEVRCDGHGSILGVYINDPTNDGNPCTFDLCESGVASNPPKAPGKACNVGSGVVCDGTGRCVECLADNECQDELCRSGLCVPLECVDMLKNGAETDVDCGGDACPPCGACRFCGEDSDCDTEKDLSCSAGVCGPCVDGGSG